MQYWGLVNQLSLNKKRGILTNVCGLRSSASWWRISEDGVHSLSQERMPYAGPGHRRKGFIPWFATEKLSHTSLSLFTSAHHFLKHEQETEGPRWCRQPSHNLMGKQKLCLTGEKGIEPECFLTSSSHHVIQPLSGCLAMPAIHTLCCWKPLDQET